jgi:hypothetical protein
LFGAFGDPDTTPALVAVDGAYPHFVVAKHREDGASVGALLAAELAGILEGGDDLPTLARCESA